MIRISFVIPTLDQSGAERQLCLLAKGLKDRGHEIRVTALNRLGHYAGVLKDAGIEVTCLEKRFRFDPLTLFRLTRQLKRESPEIVHSYLFAANTYVRLPGVCPASAKCVVSERCVDSWKSSWQVKIDRWASRRMAALTANSESVAEFYRNEAGVPHDLIHVIPNGFAASDGAATNLHEMLKLPAGTPIIGFVGRLAPQKCLNDLVWAFQLIRQIRNDVQLVLIGDGPERDSLAELAVQFECRNRVHFLGHRQDAESLISQFNIFCLPSAFEGMSNSLMEAMASGVACVVSDIPANVELISDNQTGLVFPQGNGPECAKRLRTLLDDQKLATKLGQATKARIETDFQVDAMVDAHVRLYERLLG